MGCTASISSKLEWQYTYALSIWSVVTKSFMRVTFKESLLALDMRQERDGKKLVCKCAEHLNTHLAVTPPTLLA